MDIYKVYSLNWGWERGPLATPGQITCGFEAPSLRRPGEAETLDRQSRALEERLIRAESDGPLTAAERRQL